MRDFCAVGNQWLVRANLRQKGVSQSAIRNPQSAIRPSSQSAQWLAQHGDLPDGKTVLPGRIVQINPASRRVEDPRYPRRITHDGQMRPVRLGGHRLDLALSGDAVA